MCYLVYIIVILYTIGAICHDLCPVSSTMDLNNCKNYLYPLEIYAPYELLMSAVSKNETFPCYADYKDIMRNEYHCSMNRFCPITIGNLRNATHRKYNLSSSLCHLKPKLANKNERINIYVTGGSVSGGTMSNGCSADDPIEHKQMYRRCAWSYHFGEWIKKRSAATVNMYNLAAPGEDSYVRSRMFPDTIADNHYPKFTSNDIIFLDHSSNDYGSPNIRIERGLETLILNIYLLCDKQSWPTIIVLDADPFRGKASSLYQSSYDKIVRYYNLSMWSYTDLVFSNYSLNTQKNFSDFVTWKNNYKGNHHPPWHIHLFMADLYSAIFQAELNHCTPSIERYATKLHSSPRVLPPSLFPCDVNSNCDGTHPALLTMSYADILQNKTIGSYFTVPKDSWKVREDVKDRGGIIVELVNGKYELPGQQNATIFFVANESTNSLLKRFTQMHIQLLHLRTYENAGSALVQFCGSNRIVLNALWNDYQTKKISVPDLVEDNVGLNLCFKNNYSYPTLAITHIKYDPSFKNQQEARGNEKFKILSLKMYGL